MTHFAVIAPPYYSHFQALQALCVELIERGHRVTFFHQSDAAHWLSDPRIGFRSVGAGSHPPGSLEQTLRQAARPDTPWGLRRIIKQMAGTTAMLCNELPGAFADNGIEAVLCDQMEPAGGLVGESLGLPFISVACALPVNREPGLPLPVMPFAYASDERSQHMYRGSSQVYDWLMKPLGKVISNAALRLAIAPRTALHECLSPVAQISQTLAGFDFPRSLLPTHFHAVGPLRSPATPQQGEWPIDKKRPFFFASLGTLQGDRLGLFERIAKACRRIDAQLLIAHCGKLNAAQEQQLIKHGATWVTDFAPQQWALEQADAVITHGGLNTVMDAIAARTPMLVMPIAFDQPGVAARVAYRGVGSQLSRRASVSRIEAALRALLAQPLPGFDPLIAELQQAGGVPRAADIVEAALLQSTSVRAADL
ncbi:MULTISPECIES: glycosyltransferase [Pseudomonas]|uniref:Zeaxanthin glucosyltransferase n=1 Tax=Pseudomonas fulva TaxID=47880 RepID=A0A0D0I535_9PSED|nr:MULTISPECIES: glycosyltransferase [Pseudomonas]KIP88002.1 Zeaxanthin glucosyltransferase [Pseudomonas fulva]